MIHEAMVLEYAGPDLALVKLGESMRLARPVRASSPTCSSPGGSPPRRAPLAPGARPRRARRRRWPSLGAAWPPSRWRWPSSASSGCPSCWPALRPRRAGRDLRAGDAVNGRPLLDVLTLAAGAVLVCAVVVAVAGARSAGRPVVAVQGVALGPGRPGPRRPPARRRADRHRGRRRGGQGRRSSRSLLGRARARDPASRESRPLVNVPPRWSPPPCSSSSPSPPRRGVAPFVGTTAGALVPVGVATLLLGFFVLVARRRPVFQIVGLLLVDNGIALVAFLLHRRRPVPDRARRLPRRPPGRGRAHGPGPAPARPSSATSTSTSSRSCTTDGPRRSSSPSPCSAARLSPSARGAATGLAWVAVAANGAALGLGIVAAVRVRPRRPLTGGAGVCCAPMR